MINLIRMYIQFAGMELSNQEIPGQMDLSILHSAQLGQETSTLTKLSLQQKKEQCGGMHTVDGQEQQFMVPFWSIQSLVLTIPSPNPMQRFQSYSVRRKIITIKPSKL